jgi:hypothetical protein
VPGAERLRPAGPRLLPAARDRERVGFDGLGDDRARADIGARADHYRRDERRVRADESARADLGDFVARHRSGRVHERAETERFRRFALGALMARDKLNLDVFWLKDDALDDPDLLPPPDEVAAEVVKSLEAALASFRSVAAKLAGAWRKVRLRLAFRLAGRPSAVYMSCDRHDCAPLPWVGAGFLKR